MIEINWRPTQKQLRQFAAISLVALPLLTAIWTGGSMVATTWAAGAGIVLGVLGLVCPRSIQPVFVALSLVTAPIGMVIAELAMLFIFFVLFVPLAVVFRLVGRDNLRLRRREQETYWVKKSTPSSSSRYFNQW